MFGRKDETENLGDGRYIVDHVMVGTSGAAVLQKALDEGDAKGYELREVVQTVNGTRLLIVWERPRP